MYTINGQHLKVHTHIHTHTRFVSITVVTISIHTGKKVLSMDVHSKGETPVISADNFTINIIIT